MQIPEIYYLPVDIFLILDAHLGIIYQIRSTFCLSLSIVEDCDLVQSSHPLMMGKNQSENNQNNHKCPITSEASSALR